MRILCIGDIPKLLAVSPIQVREEALINGTLFPNFDENSVAQSKLLAEAICVKLTKNKNLSHTN